MATPGKLGKRRIDHRMRDLDFDFQHEDIAAGSNERWPYVAAAAVGTVVVTFWLAVQLASLIHGFDWIPLAAGVVGAVQGLVHLPNHLGNPALGWPAELRPLVAPAWLLYPVLGALVYAEYRYGRRAWSWWLARTRTDRGHTEWASEKVLEEIWNPKRNNKIGEDCVVLGLTQRGKLLRLERESHALVVAGTRSGKTAGLCTPALLTFPGVVIATSVKSDLVENTIRRRREMGEVFIFDPVGAMGLPDTEVAGWTPLDTAREWRGAQRTADSLIEVAMNKKSGGNSGNMEFFKRMSQQTLPVLLFAAAVMDEDMRRVIKWLYRITDKQTFAEVESILRWKNNVKALDAWAGFVTKEPKIRGDIAATMASALVSYEDEKVQSNAMRCDITPERLFNGKPNTLYVVAPMAEQARLEPVFVALMQSLLLWVTEQPKPLSTPLLAVLDEAANIAALPLLPELLSTLGSQNVSIITSWQDFSQIKSRYGPQMNTILGNSRAKMVLPGIGDPETIQYFAQVTGETIEEQVSISGTKQSRSLSVGESRRQLLTPAAIREQKVGEAILVYGHLPPAKIKLRMYFKDPELKRLVAGDAKPTAAFSGLKDRLPRTPTRLGERKRTVVSRQAPALEPEVLEPPRLRTSPSTPAE